MASKESEAVRELYAGWTRTRLVGEEQDNEHWGDLTRDPGGVDYIETGADGVPAMWVIPKGAAGDRVLLCIHGGGFIGGSIYTHRKLFGHLAKQAGARALIFTRRLAPEHRHPAPLEQLRLLKIHPPYHEPGHVLNLACNVLTGGTPLDDIERLRRDVAYVNALGCGPGPGPGHGGRLLAPLHRGRHGGVDGRGQLGAHQAVARPGPGSARPRGLPRRGRADRAHHGVTQAGRPGWPSPRSD